MKRKLLSLAVLCCLVSSLRGEPGGLVPAQSQVVGAAGVTELGKTGEQGIVGTQGEALTELPKTTKEQVVHVAKRFRKLLVHLEKLLLRIKPNEVALLEEIRVLRDSIKVFVADTTNAPAEAVAVLLDTVETITGNLEHALVEADDPTMSLVEKLAHLSVVTARDEGHVLPTAEEVEARCKKLLEQMAELIMQLHTLSLSKVDAFVAGVDKIITEYHIDTLAWRTLPYILLAAYELRQQRKETVESWSIPGLWAFKWFVGSPSEKKPAFMVRYDPDVSAEEQIKWAKENGCRVVEADSGQENPLVSFANRLGVRFVDGPLVEFSIKGLFIYRLKEDLTEFKSWIQNKWSAAQTRAAAPELDMDEND